MTRVALVTCDRFPALYEDDLLLVAALDAIGIDSQPASWSDPNIDWLAFDALVIRSPWDYFERLSEFRAWLDARIASGVRMLNPAAILDWNFDKRYLQDLGATVHVGQRAEHVGPVEVGERTAHAPTPISSSAWRRARSA